MVLIDANKVQFVLGKVKCCGCNKKTAGLWPDGLCIDCYIEKLREEQGEEGGGNNKKW
jgi:hypothetical protein